MRHQVALTITSLLSILFTTFHLTDDIVYADVPGRAPEPPGGARPGRVAVRDAGARRSGCVIILVLSVLASGLPVIHMTGSAGVTAGIKPGGAFFFAWTLLALGVTAIFSVILSARGLRSVLRGQPR